MQEVNNNDTLYVNLSEGAKLDIEIGATDDRKVDFEAVDYTKYTKYTGLSNDLINILVDNENKTIEAKSDTFVFEQAMPSDAWEIQHNLDKYPSVTVVDSAGSVVIGNVLYISKNEVVVNFSAGFSGKAYLN